MLLLLLTGCRKPIRGGGGLGKMVFRPSKKKRKHDDDDEDEAVLLIAALYAARVRAGKRPKI
jgi:hypothetical protein